MIKQVLSLFLVIFLIQACDNERILPDSSGAVGEIVVVMPMVHWQGEPGKAVRALFGQAVEGLPQRESRFTLINYTPTDFPKMVRSHRNILIAEFGAEYNQAGIGEEFEKWSTDQQVIRLVGPDAQTWLALFQKEADDILKRFEEKELLRLQKQQRRRVDNGLRQKVSDEFGLSINIPKDFQLAKDESNFMHFRRDRIISSKSRDGQGFSKMGHQVIDGIFLYRYPYTNDSTFTRDALIWMRDSMLMMNVPGPKEGSYMSTQKQFEHLDLRPQMAQTVVDEKFASEMKGLWGMVGAHMGGPFVSVSFVSPDGKEIIAVEGYCFAPQFDKREYLRYVEAIVCSVRFNDT